MGRLVRNLLDLSRIEGGALKPELEPLDLDDLVRRSSRRPGRHDEALEVNCRTSCRRSWPTSST